MTTLAKRFAPLLASVGMIFASGTLAQAYPSEPITLVNPYAAGGPADLLGRSVAKNLGEVLRQTVIMETKPGAGTTIGANYVAKARPDGHTLLLGSAAAHFVTSFMVATPYDGLQDFKFIGMAGSGVNVLVVHPSVKANSLLEFIALVKANPGALNYGTSTLGSAAHLGAEMFKFQAGLNILHIPYKGAAPALADLLGGHLQMGFANLSAVMPHVKSGKLRALAYASNTRSKNLPDLPTFTEAGLPGYVSSAWYVLAAPVRTPAPIIDRLAQLWATVQASPDFQREMDAQGTDIIRLSPAETTAFILEDARKTLNMIKAANVNLK